MHLASSNTEFGLSKRVWSEELEGLNRGEGGQVGKVGLGLASNILLLLLQIIS